jgi:hypothetical protein
MKFKRKDITKANEAGKKNLFREQSGGEIAAGVVVALPVGFC